MNYLHIYTPNYDYGYYYEDEASNVFEELVSAILAAIAERKCPDNNMEHLRKQKSRIMRVYNNTKMSNVMTSLTAIAKLAGFTVETETNTAPRVRSVFYIHNETARNEKMFQSIASAMNLGKTRDEIAIEKQQNSHNIKAEWDRWNRMYDRLKQKPSNNTQEVKTIWEL